MVLTKEVGHELLRNPSIASRSKLYLIFGFVSLILFFYSVSQIAYVVTEPSDLFGLASHFTLLYWIGLALLVVCAIFAFLDKELKSDGIYLFILVILGLYLFGIATLVEENARHASIYFSLADVRNLLVTGRTDITGPYALDFYRTWPAAHFFHASIIHVAGISLRDTMILGPFFWLISFTLITYAIGRRFDLSRNSCFLLSFLALSSFWLLLSDLRQPGMALLLLLLCFMLLAKPNPRNSVGERILIILSFAALLFTHGLTSLALVTALIVLSIYRYFRREDTPFLILFSVLWLAWFMYQAFAALTLGVKRWLSAPWDYIFRMGVNVEGLYEQAYTAVPIVIQKYSSLAYFFVYGIFIAVAIYLLMGHKIKQENRKWVLVLLIWLIGLSLAGFMYLSKEMHVRLYVIGLVPVIGIILKVFSARKLLIPLMLLCLLLFFPARYGVEGYYGQVYSTELAGVRFFGYRAGSVEPWFLYRTGDLGVLAFYNPDVILWPRGDYQLSTPAEQLDLMGGASYVMNSNHGGVNDELVNRWMELGVGEEAALIYDNGDFKIYKNRLE